MGGGQDKAKMSHNVRVNIDFFKETRAHASENTLRGGLESETLSACFLTICSRPGILLILQCDCHWRQLDTMSKLSSGMLMP